MAAGSATSTGMTRSASPWLLIPAPNHTLGCASSHARGGMKSQLPTCPVSSSQSKFGVPVDQLQQFGALMRVDRYVEDMARPCDGTQWRRPCCAWKAAWRAQ